MMQSTDSSTSLKLTRRINARREDVFDAWTDPEVLKRWWAPEGTTMTSVDLDPHVGGAYRIGVVKDDGEQLYVGGKFVTIERPSRISYTWAWDEDDGPGHESLVTIDFAESGRETDVTLTHERLANEQSRDGHRHGWTSILDNLAAMYGEKKA
ncbi:MAG TPA: SRPBCC domain-containing protein [Candidatus Eremiobacteraceae bacterium]|nr:SRPBCC domain-containing protein [Candidatus Eremiobacteraceae bacterium]